METTINIKGREVVFTALPANMKTLKYLSPLLKKKKEGGDTMAAMIEAMQLSLEYKYQENEIDDILESISLSGEEDQKLLNEIVSAIFSESLK
jgi:hypothetical protein